MNFVDLFAGLGGFHLALNRLGHTCVFASELDEGLRMLYEKNHGLMPEGDIRKVEVSQIPAHDILAAGFPCQPFSKAGGQEGFNHPIWGDLFDQVLRIVRHHQPNFVLLENVPNLERHDAGRTWARIRYELESEGYAVDARRLSPHQFGVPQIRERMFIVASRQGLNGFSWPLKRPISSDFVKDIIEYQPSDARAIPEHVEQCLDVWQDFLDRVPTGVSVPYFPLWTMEFGATYPYEDTTPHAIGTRGLTKYRGSHGRDLRCVPPAERMALLPSHARTPQAKFPRWKQDFIRWNRKFYVDNREWIEPWLPKIQTFPSSFQKLEWNCKGGALDLRKYLIQFRASGVRIKRPTHAPSLIAMNTTQVPIIGWERRYLTPREAQKLQSMGELSQLPELPVRAFRALGNAVNVDLVELIARALLHDDTTARLREHPYQVSLFAIAGTD